MLVYCKNCNAPYRVDINRLSSEKTKGKCKKCGKLIDFSEFMENPPDSDNRNLFEIDELYHHHLPDWKNRQESIPVTSGIGFRILFPFIVLSILAIAGVAGLYLKFIPDIISRQIDLRAQSISRSFSAGIFQPLMLKNYLAVNKTASMHAELPDVAYVAVLNHYNKMVAGITGKKEKFSQEFRDRIEKDGFPAEILAANDIGGSDISVQTIEAGGIKIHDAAFRINDSLGIVHIGLFNDSADREIISALWPVIIFLTFLAAAGSLIMARISRGITNPVKNLSRAAQQIAVGNTEAPIIIQGKGEIEALSESLEIMRKSIDMEMRPFIRKNIS